MGKITAFRRGWAYARAQSRRRTHERALVIDGEESGVHEQPVQGLDGIAVRIWIGRTGRGRNTNPEVLWSPMVPIVQGALYLVTRGGWSVYAAPDSFEHPASRAQWRIRCRSRSQARRTAQLVASVVRDQGWSALSHDTVRPVTASR